MHDDIRVSARHTVYSRNLAATCDGRSTDGGRGGIECIPSEGLFQFGGDGRGGGARRMRVRGDNGCDKLVHVRRAKEPLERGDGLAEGGRERGSDATAKNGLL